MTLINFFKKFQPPSISFFFWMVIAINIIFHLPTLTVQESLGSGNVGDNIYLAEAVSRGEIPYRDFNWNYGPLMLYYNAFCFNLMGHDIHSLIIGRIFLKTIFAGILFIAGTQIMPASAAFLTTLLYMALAPDFIHNLSHYGGVGLEIAILWAILRYGQSAQENYVRWTFGLVLLLGLNKINFGIALLGASVPCLLLYDFFKHQKNILKRGLVYVGLSFGVIFAWIAILYFFVKGLSWAEINQCFPIMGHYVYFGRNISDGFFILIRETITNARNNRFDGFIFILGLWAVIRLIVEISCHFLYHKKTTTLGRNYLMNVSVLLLLVLASYNEYYKGGLDYEAYWAKPFTIMLIAYLISEAATVSGKTIRVFLVMMGMVIFFTHAHDRWAFLERYKTPEQFYKHKGINIYATCDKWDIEQISDTENFIEKNIPQKEPIFVFPDDSLYYFLSGRLAPDRLLLLFGSVHIVPDQERKLIANLEKKKVKYIITNDVCYFGNMWGYFGRDNCPIFYQYLNQHFHKIANFETTISPWTGTTIYQKN